MSQGYISWAQLQTPPHGVTTEAVAVAETGTASSAPSAVAVFVVSTAESGTASDTSSSGAAVLTAAVAETGSATTSPSAVSVLPVVVAESGTATSTSSASTPARGYISWARLQLPPARPAVNAAVTESGSAVALTSGTGGLVPASVAEIASAIATTASSGGSIAAIIAEPLAAIDVASAGTGVSVYLAWTDLQLAPSTAAATEAGGVVDAVAAVSLRLASRVEAGSVADTGTVQADYRPAVAEALAGAELQSAIGGASPVAQVENLVLADDSDGIGGITPVVIAEIGVALDTPTGAAQLFSVAAESASAADTLDGTDSASMFESLVANDVPDAVMITFGSIAEGTASAADVAAAAVIWEVAVTEAVSAFDFQVALSIIPPVFEDEPRTRITLQPKGARLGQTSIQPPGSSLG